MTDLPTANSMSVFDVNQATYRLIELTAVGGVLPRAIPAKWLHAKQIPGEMRMRNVLCNALKPAVLATAVVAVCGLTAEAATVSLSTATPAVGAGVENLTLSTSQSDVTQVQYSGNYLAGDTGVAVGQTFTTGSNAGGYILSAISVHQIGSFNTFYDYTGGTITAQVFQTGTSVGGGVQNIVPLSTETASVGGEDDGMTYANGILGANAKWLTITLATPLTLLPNTQYGFQLASSGTTGNDGFFMELDGTNTNRWCPSRPRWRCAASPGWACCVAAGRERGAAGANRRGVSIGDPTT